MRPLLISSGEPAGIGPDLCLALAEYDFPVVILCDLQVLKNRAKQLNLNIQFNSYNQNENFVSSPGQLTVMPLHCKDTVVSGQLNSQNASYVLEMLTMAAELCVKGEFSALVTAPVHKAIINEAGNRFTGHTEFLADYYKAESVVMMLACEQMKVALVTTHLPLRLVSDAITSQLIVKVIKQVNSSLITDFGIKDPKIKVAGLNPHAGEAGYLGREEIDSIIPALELLSKSGINVKGPMPADTMFKQDQENCDVYVAMYHDQGLPVLKYAGFGQAVNITLGLPIIRTSVDHGTALDLAGKGIANAGSLITAVKMAMIMAKNRTHE